MVTLLRHDIRESER